MISNHFVRSLCRPHESEYIHTMPKIMEIVRKHREQMKPGEPQLNFCDPAVMVIIFSMPAFVCRFFVKNFNSW